MTKQTRRKFSAEFKAKVALEAIKNQKTLAQLSQQFEVNPITISKWKSEFLENMSVVFDRSKEKRSDASDIAVCTQTVLVAAGSLELFVLPSGPGKARERELYVYGSIYRRVQPEDRRLGHQ